MWWCMVGRKLVVGWGLWWLLYVLLWGWLGGGLFEMGRLLWVVL